MVKKTEMNPKSKLREIGLNLVNYIKKGENPFLDIPIRALSNVIFDPHTNLIKMGDKTAKRYLFNVAHIRKFVQTIDAAAISKRLLEENKHVSLRQVYYMMKGTLSGSGVEVVSDGDEGQTESNKAVEDLELITGLTREQLNINAKKLGSVAGKVIIEDGGDTIDWSKQGSGGWSVPSNVENIKFKKVNAKFVLYMEKDAIWERLNEDKVWNKLDCVIIASQGQATRGIRRLLQRMSDELRLPIYVLADFDPWGFYIYSVLKFGSIALSHISDRLAIPKAHYLGLTADDVEKYELTKYVIKFKDVDIKRLKEVSEYEWFKNRKEWQRQFQLMNKIKGKVELDALVTKGVSFISEKYIPEKIKSVDVLN
ncbi:MAG: DNA topoisomerase IV subunit A [Candidatus Aenigmatarchaeota archaeon]|nr:DNA topoisomerase IV subunit A [Candidatus Aenigmarchaeota archaeon]